jgi:hypothetical protein
MIDEGINALVTRGYGIKDEDLDEFLPRENLRDISKNYSLELAEIQKKFSVKDRIRIIEFDERSGSNQYSNAQYREMISEEFDIAYCGPYSNRDCCVIFLYAGFNQKQKRLLPGRILPHEYAHHFQFARAGFPCIQSRKMPKEVFPEFVTNFGIGPEKAELHIDGTNLPTGIEFWIKDITERISDFVCERILLKINFSEMLLDQYHLDTRIDPMSRFMHVQIPPPVQKYMKRLSLVDEAYWQSLLCKTYSDVSSFKHELEYNKNWVLKLNKDFQKGKQTFGEVLNSANSTDCNEFKKVERVVDYVKWLALLLDIEIVTAEKW